MTAPPSERPPLRSLGAADAHWVAWGIVGGLSVAGSVGTQHELPVLQRVVVAAYELGHALALGAVTWLAARSWRAPKRWPRWAPHLALGVAAFGVSGAVLAGDLESFTARQSAHLAPLWVPLFSLVAAMAVVASATFRVAERARTGVAVAALTVASAHRWVLPLLYPGAHLIVVWCAALILGRYLTGSRWPRFPVSARVVRAVGGLALLSVAVAPPATAHAALQQRTSAVVAPYVSRLWAVASGEAGRLDAELVRSPWFRSRRDAPAVAARALETLPGPPIVVVVTIDALRADVLEAERAANRFPALHALGRRSLRFMRAWAPSPGTYPSMGSLFMGTYRFQQHWEPSKRSKNRQEYPDLDPSPRVPELLAAAGVDPWLVASHGGLRSKWGIGRGFTREVTMGYWPHAEDVVTKLLSLLEKHQKEHAARPLFLFTHLLEPHAPYDRGKRSGSAFRRYLSEVQVVDEQIARLVQAIESSPDAERTVLVVSADHGEAFGEHGAYHHRTTVYDEMVRVPLLVHVPGASGRVVDTPVTLLDVPPTLLDLFGVDTPGHFMGQSLLGLVRGEAPRLDRPIFVDSIVGAQAMVFPDGLKAIVNDVRGTRELYDLNADPREKRNLVSRADAARYFGALRAFVRAHAWRSAQ